MSGILPYSMSKSFSSYLAQGLNVELKDKVDVMSYQPGEVQTKLIVDRKVKVTV
jgi:short-subunit dehydrogenase